jgi:CBS domain-containing protein
LGTLVSAILDTSIYVLLALRKRPSTLAVHNGRPLRDAVALMLNNDVHAVAIIDDDGAVIGSVSERTLKGLTADTLALDRPIGRDLDADIVLEAEASVGDAVDAMLKSGRHHVWICRERHRIDGVITWTDVLGMFE